MATPLELGVALALTRALHQSHPACSKHSQDLLAPAALKFETHGIRLLSMFWTLNSLLPRILVCTEDCICKTKRELSQGKTGIIHICFPLSYLRLNYIPIMRSSPVISNIQGGDGI